MTRNKLYSIVLALSMAGYAWFLWNYHNLANSNINVCLFKKITGLPCPSCGTTRAIICITRGNFLDALNTNPLGFVVILMLIVIPIWILLDLITKKNGFHSFYKKSELILRKKWIALPAVVLILVVWVLNIIKKV